ncbi:endonuclease/exonuclease/phosphatase family protein [uncultured Croceitalea sp.]|uniref:endonuclease/exonuclease/phosphatase family protein n=1 Tax=uncultured Croceitalea sp. TaxID=1798908 RepID=UPI0033068921
MRLLTLPFLLILTTILGQNKKTFKVRTIAFYNVENLFDIQNDSLIFDDERTPKGNYQWTYERYHQKINNITRVLAEIGKETTTSAPDVIGLCEVENLEVVEDLVGHENLRQQGYGIIHFDSPDERGIDVALLFKKEAFLPTSFKSHRLLLFNEDGYRNYTRDQLVVGGFLDDEKLYFIVNHWPSRSGGESRSKPNRIKAAQLNKRIIDSLQKLDYTAKIISMGDLNDDPIDDSLHRVLKTKGKLKGLDSLSLFNPMERLHKKGMGSLAYRDRWNLFDQFVLTPNLVIDEDDTYSFWKAGIFAPAYLKNSDGKYKGYPYRAFVGTTYQGGYSDHFPVYLFLIKEVE